MGPSSMFYGIVCFRTTLWRSSVIMTSYADPAAQNVSAQPPDPVKPSIVLSSKSTRRVLPLTRATLFMPPPITVTDECGDSMYL